MSNDFFSKKIAELMNYFCNVENIGNGRFVDKIFQEILIKHAQNAEGIGTLGYVKHKLDEGELLQTKNSLLNEIKVCLAGMASEEIFYSEFSNGNTSDLQTATNIAKNMVTRYGMSSLGLGQIKKPDDKLSTKVDEEVNSILGECYNKTKDIIKNNMELIRKLVGFLIKQKEISEEEFLYIINKEIKGD